MHFVIVAACSAFEGSIITPDKPTPTSGAEDGGAGGTSPLDASVAAGSSPAPGKPKQPAMGIPIPEAQAAESGTRLKARWYVGADGTRQWAFNWFDSERNEECSFQPATDGVLRCLPTGTAAIYTYYLDAECSQPAVAHAAPSGCNAEAVRYLTQSEIVGCEYRTRLTSPGQLMQQTTQYTLSGESCVEVPLPATYVLRRPGAEVPPTSFVAAEISHDP
jgi:hypothetical protein